VSDTRPLVPQTPEILWFRSNSDWLIRWRVDAIASDLTMIGQEKRLPDFAFPTE